MVDDLSLRCSDAERERTAQALRVHCEAGRLTVDEAVQTALENNLGVQLARIDPAIHDLDVAGARAAWFPSFSMRRAPWMPLSVMGFSA